VRRGGEAEEARMSSQELLGHVLSPVIVALIVLTKRIGEFLCSSFLPSTICFEAYVNRSHLTVTITQVEDPLSKMLETGRISDFGRFLGFENICICIIRYLVGGT
jgi:hypothetical protein